MPLANKAPPVHEPFRHIGLKDLLQRFLEQALEEILVLAPKGFDRGRRRFNLVRGAVTVIRSLGQVGLENQPWPWPPPACKQVSAHKALQVQRSYDGKWR